MIPRTKVSEPTFVMMVIERSVVRRSNVLLSQLGHIAAKFGMEHYTVAVRLRMPVTKVISGGTPGSASGENTSMHGSVS